jgi:hypothetical protein
MSRRIGTGLAHHTGADNIHLQSRLLPNAFFPDPMPHLFTCGSVDDGKSTLLGRLLFDTHCLPDDLLAKVQPQKAGNGASAAPIIHWRLTA